MAKIPVLGIASDGDKCDNARQEKLFNSGNAVEGREGIRAALGHITTDGEPFPISDLLHLAKHWHSRMMKYRLTVVVPGPSVANASSASIQSVIETLGPRRSLTNESQRVIALNGRWASIFAALHLTKFLIWLHGCEQGSGGRRPQRQGTVWTSLSGGLGKNLSLKKLPCRSEN
jgi:hypothetical protein